MHQNRRDAAQAIREAAARKAANRPHPRHINNGEEYEYRNDKPANHPEPPARLKPGYPTHLANFTKGLPHDETTGLLLNPYDYRLFVRGIQTGDPADFRETPLGPADAPNTLNTPSVAKITPANPNPGAWSSNLAEVHQVKPRAWESAAAGNVFDLEGPDAQAVTMPPAPRLDSDELAAEIAEVYAMALMRDTPFNKFPMPTGSVRTVDGGAVGNCDRADEYNDALNMLRGMTWFQLGSGVGIGNAEPQSELLKLDEHQLSRLRNLSGENSHLFRGVTKGVRVGPYLSQFMLLGTKARGGGRVPTDGFLGYGSLSIEQKVRVAHPCKDYLTVWETYLDAQNGADFRGMETYVPPGDGAFRFIATPRDLATYVHYDELYEAYLNACLFLLGNGAPLDPGIPYQGADVYDKQQGFAHFGGPHILSLMTEVATRALKAVRYQKFYNHRRLRPEAVGGRLDRWLNQPDLGTGPLAPLKPLADRFGALNWGDQSFIERIIAHNAGNNAAHFNKEKSAKVKSLLLPMAFAEGSPMHPAYGAGHATVAGACVTILKAFFDHGHSPFQKDGQPFAYEPASDGSQLNLVKMDRPLTVEGELNKLAANISIGRNWAGVHYYSDYIESLRMGEQVAIGLLEEQKLTYPETFTMAVPLFDGGSIQI